MPAATQVTGPIDENQLTALPNNARRLGPEEVDEGPVASTLPQNHILMLLRRSSGRETALERFMQEQYDPQSRFFHKWLTPEQFGEFFGPSAQDISQVTQWLTGHGFTINQVPAGRTFIDFSGTAGQVETAFHTPIHDFRRNGNDHFSNTQEPSIPTALAQIIAGFRGLNNFHPVPLNARAKMARLSAASGAAGSQAAHGHFNSVIGSEAFYLVTPQDFAQIYNIKPVWQQNIRNSGETQKLVGTGQTIGIAGDTVLQMSSIQSFRDQFGLTPLGPNGSVVTPQPPASVCTAPASDSNDMEGYLDVEWAGATAPDATIDFVACADDGVTSGIDLAAAYIVHNADMVKQVEVLSTSFGYCEKDPTSETDDFYVQLWQQAAAEGITVVVASGDGGSEECDDDGANLYASQGLSVDAEASTPYNIAAGGTDFSDAFSGTIGRYWSQSNSPLFQSAQSYIPETPWNESCANPLYLASDGQGFTKSYGPDGFCTYASEQPNNALSGIPPYFYNLAGSGGLSTVSSKPRWQTGVYGIPPGNARALPDISLFAAAGLSSVHALVLCDAAIIGATTCDYSNPEVLYDQSNGGTSFAAPSFAGIIALIDQKSGARQGQANYVLYPLAGEQFLKRGSAKQPSLANCAAYLGNDVLQSCYFHDISGTPNPDSATRKRTPFYIGNISVPCTGSATGPGVYTNDSAGPVSDNENCYGYEITVTQNGTSLTTTPDYYGVTSTEANDDSPAFPATPGYDLATGLGSPNVFALVNAPQWSSGGRMAHIELTPVHSTVSSSNKIELQASVTADLDGAPVQGGDVTFFSAGQALGIVSLRCGGEGRASLSLPGSAFGASGNFNDVYASYAGSTENCSQTAGAYYYSTVSAAVTVEVVVPLKQTHPSNSDRSNEASSKGDSSQGGR